MNLKKLAEHLRLSIATVSKALRDSHEVKPATKQRVWEMARQLNYQPNPFASGLRAHKSKTIAVLFPDLDNHFFSLAIKGIEEVARANGYHVLIYLTHESFLLETALANSLLGGRADGLLLSLSRETRDYRHIHAVHAKIPVVLFDRVCDTSHLSTVTTNDYESSYAATGHLLQQGCRRIAYLSALGALDNGQKRLQGYARALQEAGIFPDEQLVVHCEEEDSSPLIRSMMAGQRPDGIFSSIEKLVTPCYHIARELGMQIPGDLKIIGFSNLDNAALLDPSLSTITQPAFEIGREAARTLFRQLLKRTEACSHTVINSVLIPRHSTLAQPL